MLFLLAITPVHRLLTQHEGFIIEKKEYEVQFNSLQGHKVAIANQQI